MGCQVCPDRVAMVIHPIGIQLGGMSSFLVMLGLVKVRVSMNVPPTVAP